MRAAFAHAHRLAPVALVGLVLLFFRKMAFTDGILSRGDIFLYFYPYWEYRAQALAAGRLPLWNPHLFMGAPFLANSQAGVLYPLNWPLAALGAPAAVKVALLAHLAWAALGTFAFARRALNQSRVAAFLAASLFALGGYLTAQVEHVNQVQGLAWLPWLLLAVHALARRVAGRTAGWQSAAALNAALASLIVALQLLAGHTQSAFISVVAACLLAAATALAHHPPNFHLRLPIANYQSALGALAWLGVATILAACLSAAQLLPTLELSSQSVRSGGLPLREAVSFSLDPRLLGRALLPSYSRGLFSEFTAYLGVAGSALAALGALGARRQPSRLPLVLLGAVGLLFALGGFNPLFLLMAGFPPLNLFRVPARWLVLLAFAGAVLAGYGLDDASTGTPRRRLALALALPLALAVLAPLASRLVPAGETGPLGPPGIADWTGWLLTLIAVAGSLWRWHGRGREFTLTGLALVELFAAAQVLAYNHPTTPAAWTSLRPAMLQLLAARTSASPTPSGSTQTLLASSSLVTTVTSAAPVPLPAPAVAGQVDRFLSISGLRFDPGDAAELRTALVPPLPEDAFYDFIVATKHKEVLSPNLPLAWGVAAVDGYDGGVLPLRHYADFTSLFTGAPSTDGRLRENVGAPPDPSLLALVNGRYLITDKVQDAWVEGVFYDLEFTLTLADGQRAPIAHVPHFQATALGVVADAYGGSVALTLADGTALTLPITSSRTVLPGPVTPISITLAGPLALRGLSLIDTRSGAFQSLTLGPYRLVHSGDVKVYEHQAVLPRAFVVPRAEVLADEDALARLSDRDFDPAGTVLLAEAGGFGEPAFGAASRRATISGYAPETVELLATGPGYLVLTDAYYPGWSATVDGQPAAILRADVMFRSLALPPGEHAVVFRYEPRSVRVGLAVSGVAWVGLVVGILVLWARRAARGRRATRSCVYS